MVSASDPEDFNHLKFGLCLLPKALNEHTCSHSVKFPSLGFRETLIWKHPWCSLTMHGTLPTAKTWLWHPEGGTPFDREEFGKGISSPHLQGVGFTPPASFLTISPLGDVSTFNLLLRTVWNLSRGWSGRMRNNERKVLGVRTGTCHSHFQSGRRNDQRLRLPMEKEYGLRKSHYFVASSKKHKLKNGTQDH